RRFSASRRAADECELAAGDAVGPNPFSRGICELAAGYQLRDRHGLRRNRSALKARQQCEDLLDAREFVNRALQARVRAQDGEFLGSRALDNLGKPGWLWHDTIEKHEFSWAGG